MKKISLPCAFEDLKYRISRVRGEVGNAFGFCPKIVKNDILLIFNLDEIVLLLDSTTNI